VIIEKHIPTSYIKKIDSYEGLIFLILSPFNPTELKKIAINIEDYHPLGRLVDIDVLDISNEPISRTTLGFPKRKCYLCLNEAHICVRTQAHSITDILNYIENTVKKYKEGLKDV
jgi:holo-ACP synthase